MYLYSVSHIASKLLLQKDHVIAEIEKHGCPTSESDRMTIKYLKALNLIFERGILVLNMFPVLNQLCCRAWRRGSSSSQTGNKMLVIMVGIEVVCSNPTV